MGKYEVRGGARAMCAVEPVADRDSKAPIDKTTIATVHSTTYEAGTLVRVSGSNIILSPPLVLTDRHVKGILSALDAGLAAVT